jgi:hypothetical protein
MITAMLTGEHEMYYSVEALPVLSSMIHYYIRRVTEQNNNTVHSYAVLPTTMTQKALKEELGGIMGGGGDIQ